MSQLLKNTEELGARSRENKRFSQGRVIGTNPIAHTAVVDVGARLPDGTTQHLYNVPYVPQSPPAVGATVSLDYFGTSTHSVRIVSTGVGGQNAQDTVQINAGNVVNSIKKTGETSGQAGDIILDPGDVVTINRSGKTFTFAIPDAGVTDAKLALSYIKTDGTRAFSGDQSMGTHKITNLTDPSNAQDAATKAYVDAVATGLDVKASCRVATTANITLSGTQTIDGVSVIAGDRVLVKNQSTGANNGIYVCASGAWSRSTDADTSAKVTAGMFTFVTEGTTNGDKGWVLTTNDPITLGSTSLSFSQFSGAGSTPTGTGFRHVTSGTEDGATKLVDTADINANQVTNAKLAQMAAHTFKGNNTGSTTDPSDLTATQLTAELNAFTSSLKGLAPSSGGGTSNFLRADGTWAAPSAGSSITVDEVDGSPSVSCTQLTFPNGTLSNSSGHVTYTPAPNPFWRWRYYAASFGGAKLDWTYFDPFQLAPNTGSNVVRYSPEYTDGPGGSFRLSVGDTQLVFWARMGITNTTGGDITITFDVVGHDDSLVVLNEYGTDLAGTVAISGTTVTGTGTALSTDFANNDDYIRVAAIDGLFRFPTAPSTSTSGTLANGPTSFGSGWHYRLAKKIYAATGANAAVNGHYTATIKAGQTHVIHLLGNNNTGGGYWIVNLDALTISGLVFSDAGA